jgi:perosamine synthetase
MRHPPSDPVGSLPQLRGRWVIGTYRGRSAVALACCLLGVGPGHEVLVPSYNCGTEVDAVLHSGAQIVGYRVSRRCEIDMQDLIARRSSRTKAVYLIHYFGWEQSMEELRRWCDKQGLLLIEDCALALFSTGSSGSIGRTGDAAIFSLSKTLGLYHGGLLSMPTSKAVEISGLAPAGFSALLKEVLHSARAKAYGSLEWLGILGAVLFVRHHLHGNRARQDEGGDYAPMPDDYYFNPEMDANRALHPQAWTVAGLHSSDEIVRRRRSNYMRLASILDGIHGVELLHSQLPPGICPLSLPLLVSNRNACAERLQARGIAAFPWWAGFHRNSIDWSQFPEACWLKQNMLTLPVHQGMDDRHLKYVAETAAQVLRHSPRDIFS